MATTALVIGVVSSQPAAAGGLELVFSVAFGLDGGGIDLSNMPVVLAAGDSGQVINSKLSSAVTDLATSLGYSVAKSAITLPSYSKG